LARCFIGLKDTIAAPMGLSDVLRKPFSFLFAGSKSEDRIAAYLIREHEHGRTVAEILEDQYMKNRATPQQVARVLDRPEVIHALGASTAASAKAEIKR
jgi:hypothetical protein